MRFGMRLFSAFLAGSMRLLVSEQAVQSAEFVEFFVGKSGAVHDKLRIVHCLPENGDIKRNTCSH